MLVTGTFVYSHVQLNLLFTEVQWTTGDLVLHNTHRQAQLCITGRRVSISLWGIGSSFFLSFHIKLSDRTFSMQICIALPEG